MGALCVWALALALALAACGRAARPAPVLSTATTGSALSIAAGFTVSPEHATDDPVPSIEWAPPSGTAMSACGTSSCLVAWAVYGVGVVATRIAADGTLLDSSPILVTSLSWEPLAVVAGGADFLVAWGGTGSGFGTHATRVHAADAAVLDGPVDAGGILVSADEPSSLVGAYDGANYIVVWPSSRSAPTAFDVYAARIDGGTGALIDGPPRGGGILVATSGNYLAPAGIVFDGARYLVVLQGSTGTTAMKWGARVGTDGSLLDGPASNIGFPIEQGLNGPAAVAYGAGIYFVASNGVPTGTDGSTNVVTARRIRASDAALLDGPPSGPGIAIAQGASQSNWPYPIAVAFDGANFAAVYGEPAVVSGRRVRASDGALLDATTPAFALNGTSPPSYPPAPLFPTAAFCGDTYLVTWSDRGPSGASEVYGARVRASDLALLDGSGGRIVSRSANTEQGAVIVSSGAEDLVAWWDTRNVAGIDLYAVRVDPTTGISRDAAARRLTVMPPPPTSRTQLTAAFDGTSYVLAWGANDGVHALHVRASDATVLDGPAGTIVSAAPPAGSVNVACDPTRCLFTWGTGRYGVRVRTRDQVVEDSTPIALFAFTYDLTGLASDGTNFLVTTSASAATVQAKRIRSSDGVVLDGPGGAPGINVSSTPAGATSAAFDGHNFLVVWGPTNVYGYVDKIGAARLTPDGTPLDGPAPAKAIPIAGSAGPVGVQPLVSFDGWSYVVAWPDIRFGPTQLYAGRVTPSGESLDLATGGWPISPEPLDSTLPIGITCDTAGHSVVAYGRFDVASPLFSTRAKTRAVYERPSGIACTAPSDCTSGFCVDGVCCDGACGNGDVRDCMACSRTKGAARDGVCGPAVPGQVCGTPVDCLSSTACDGLSTVCPAPTPLQDGTSCTLGACVGGTCVALDAGIAFEGGPADAATPPDVDANVPNTTTDAGPAGAAADDTEIVTSGGCGCRSARLTGDGWLGLGGLGAAFLARACLRKRRTAHRKFKPR